MFKLDDESAARHRLRWMDSETDLDSQPAGSSALEEEEVEEEDKEEEDERTDEEEGEGGEEEFPDVQVS